MTATTAVVIGADQPVGGALAEAIAHQIDAIALGGADEERLDERGSTLETATEELITIRTDVRDEFDVERLMEQAARLGGGQLDFVFCCGRVSHIQADVSPAQWAYSAFDDEFRTNHRGVFATIREAIPHCHAQSRIIVPLGFQASQSGSFRAGEAAIGALVGAIAEVVDCHVVGVDIGEYPLDSEMTDIPAAELLRAVALEVDDDRLEGAILTGDDLKELT